MERGYNWLKIGRWVPWQAAYSHQGKVECSLLLTWYGGKEWENQWHLKISRDWKCVHRGCQITGAGNNTYMWLDKHVWACMHVVCPFACSRLYKPFFFSCLLRQNKGWEINTSLPWACLYRTAGVELVNEEEVTSDRQFVIAHSCTPMPGATKSYFQGLCACENELYVC